MIASPPDFHPQPELLAFDLMRLNMTSKSLASKTRSWAIKGGWEKQVELADQLEAVVAKNKPQTTDTAIKTVQESLNIIFYSPELYYLHP